MAKEKKEVVEYIVPLKKAYNAPRSKRAKKAKNLLKKFIVKHFRTKNIKISPKLNEIIFARGIEKPPRKIAVKVLLKDNIANVYSAAEKIEVAKEKKVEEKKEKVKEEIKEKEKKPSKDEEEQLKEEEKKKKEKKLRERIADTQKIKKGQK
ncbi:MAG: 60S ribosomal protein L31 [Candidatus Diapherotrites archaeon]|nr:60S ribosomal protein L31 [Candidatus Diapherotrites archaeon]